MLKKHFTVVVLAALLLGLLAPVAQACDPGCTLTPGYWKTHSMYGPAGYDDTWAFIGEDTEFFATGYSWYEMMQVPPKGGNGYVKLAHQYIAAQLNFLAGADPSAVLSEFGQATVLLSTYGPGYDWKGDPDEVTGLFVDLAEDLDDYNNGYIGPGHCAG